MKDIFQFKVTLLVLACIASGCGVETASNANLSSEMAAAISKRGALISEFGLDAVAKQITICPDDPNIVRIEMDVREGDRSPIFVRYDDIETIYSRSVPKFKLGENPITLQGLSLRHDCSGNNAFCSGGTIVLGLSPGMTDDLKTPDFDERMTLVKSYLTPKGWVEPNPKYKESKGYYSDSRYVVKPTSKYGLNAHVFNQENDDLPVYQPQPGSTRRSYFESHFDDILLVNMSLNRVESNKNMFRIICGPSIRTNAPERKTCAVTVVSANGLLFGEQIHLDALRTWTDFDQVTTLAAERYGKGGNYGRTCGL